MADTKNYIKDCRHCKNIGEDIVGGTNELFCQIFNEDEIEAFDPSIAQVCDFYDFDENYGLYFHKVPTPQEQA